MAATAESLEQQCPACGATFRLADRRKRVQCPRCQEIVDIAPAPRPAPKTNGTGELAELKARLSRLEDLATRTEILEREVAELRGVALHRVRVERLPSADSDSFPDLHWNHALDHSVLVGEIAPAQRKTLLANLAAIGSRRIVIQVCAGDPLAGRLAVAFRDVFEEAGWKVPPVERAPDHLRRHALALTAQPASSPQEMAVLFMALAAAGFKVVSQIDPALEGTDPILSVGPQS